MLKLIGLIDQNSSTENINTLVDLICHQFYENLLIQNPENEELLILCYLLLEKEVDNMNSASVQSFLDESNTFIGKLLKSYTKKQELKTYLTVTLGSLILLIENNSDGCIDLDLGRLSQYIFHKNQNNVQNKSYNEEKTKNFLGIDNENLTKNIHRSRLSKVGNIQSQANSELIEDLVTKYSLGGLNSDNILPSVGTYSENLMKEVSLMESCSYKPKNVTSTNKVSSSINNDFVLELVDDVSDYKYPKFEEDEEFNTDYKIEMTQEELSSRLRTETDENMKDFYIIQLERINKNPYIFTNKNLLLNLRECSNSQQVLMKYKENFKLLKEYIDIIIKSLLENTSTIPYTLRCICKIIKILIDRKFPDISKCEKNALIGEFIFGKCILPILINSDLNAVITCSILSANTKKCLKIISKILTRIYRGMFFDGNSETYFTIFNHYIIEIIPAMNQFYDNLIDVPLPKILDELIFNYEANREDKFCKYNYFKENEEELLNIQCICFSIKDIQLIVKYLKANINMFKNNSKSISNSNLLIRSVEKISNAENLLNHIVKLNPKRSFFLIFNNETNPEKVDLLYPKTFRFTFTNEIENNEIILKRIKFCIKLILRGINLINHRVYAYLTTATSTQNFFTALNQILQLEEYTETEYNDKIPINWYSLYMMSNLQYLSEEYKANDYDKLFNELLKEGKKEIEFLNIKSNIIIAKYGLNTRCVEKIIEKIKRDLIKVKQIEKYIKMEKFIKKTEIKTCIRIANKEEEPVEINTSGFFGNLFNWNKRKTVNNTSSSSLILIQGDEESSTIEVKSCEKCLHKRLLYLEKLTEGKPEKKSSKGKKNDDKIDCHASNIFEFLSIFGKYNELKEDIIKGDQRHKIYVTLNNYIKIVKEFLIKDELFQKLSNDEIEEILEGIENYIMKKLHRRYFIFYFRIYPAEASDIDKEFFERTCKLSYITPSHLDINKAYLNENLMSLAIDYVNKIDTEKTPYDKLKCIASAHKIINNCIKFCSGKDENAGADDLSPIFQYIIIKAKPKRIFSNIKYNLFYF